MNINRIQTIIDKEWNEIFKNRIVLFTLIVMPLMLTLLPLVILFFTRTGGVMTGDSADVPPQFMQVCGAINPMDCMQYFLINQFLLMFMMMPLIIPTAIAAYSIVGEKTTRSLEPLLATPITTVELLVGKAAAAALPAILATWACFLIFVLLMPLAGASDTVVKMVIGPTWLIAILIIGPLMAIASVNMAVIVSSRVNDPRVAEQISGVLVVPILGLLFGQLAGLIIINPYTMIISTLIMIAIDAALIYAGARLFQREAILTRWK